MQRYYSNNVTDGERQDAIDLFLGTSTPERGGGSGAGGSTAAAGSGGGSDLARRLEDLLHSGGSNSAASGGGGGGAPGGMETVAASAAARTTAAASRLEEEMRARDETELRQEEAAAAAGPGAWHPPLRRRLLEPDNRRPSPLSSSSTSVPPAATAGGGAAAGGASFSSFGGSGGGGGGGGFGSTTGARRRGPFWHDAHQPGQLTCFDRLCAYDFNVSCLDAAAVELLEALPEPKGPAGAAIDAYLAASAVSALEQENATRDVQAAAAVAQRAGIPVDDGRGSPDGGWGASGASTNGSSGSVTEKAPQEALYQRYLMLEATLSLADGGIGVAQVEKWSAAAGAAAAKVARSAAVEAAATTETGNLANGTATATAGAADAVAIATMDGSRPGEPADSRLLAAPPPLRPGARAQL
ncbi:unnamed protein product, partial [Phaeothamnion confervicola]